MNTDKKAKPDLVAAAAPKVTARPKRDRLFFAALAAVRHHADASAETIQKQLGVVPQYAEQLLQDLELEGYVTKPRKGADGFLQRDLTFQKSKEEWLTREGLAREERRSRTVQQALLRQHPARAGINQIAKLIEDEVVAILSAYQKAHLIEIRKSARPGSEPPPSNTVREIGFNVGTTIAGILASEDEWPNGSQELLSQQDQLTLFRNEIFTAWRCDDQCNHYFRQSQLLHIPDGDLVDRPGWDHMWLRNRLGEIGIFRNTAVGRELLPGIRYVVIKKDGSGAIVTEDGAVKKF
jgi:hypothetical protein